MDADELPLPTVSRPNTYRVVQEDWALQFQRTGRPNPRVEGIEVPPVALADLTCRVAPDGSALGLAVYDLEGRPAAFLPLVFPSGSEVVAASTAGLAVVPRRDGHGRILIPLPEGGPVRVVVLWKMGGVTG